MEAGMNTAMTAEGAESPAERAERCGFTMNT